MRRPPECDRAWPLPTSGNHYIVTVRRAMTRKQFLTASVSGLAAGRVSAQAPRAAGSRPKNVLFLLSDQHRPSSLGLQGDPFAHTPNLDALAHTGMRFEHAYCSNPVCTPSRASI